jgi:DNA end-binding protein Ku
MTARANWNGHIRLSLVTFPVHLYAAVTATEKIQLHKIDRASGKRIHYVNATPDDQEVEPEDIVKGYEYEKGQYIQIEDEEIDKLRAESKHTIDLVQFTDMKDIDAVYFDKPYFIAPDGPIAVEAYVTLRDALRKAGKAALGQITLAGKERLAVIKPCGKGLVLETLRYEYEVRKANEYFRDIPKEVSVDDDQVELAAMLIEKKSGDFDPSAFKDRYQEGLLEIINAKLHHKKLPEMPTPKAPGKVVNIMDALKRSLEESGKTKPAAAKSAGKPKAKPVKKAAKPAAKTTLKRKAG